MTNKQLFIKEIENLLHEEPDFFSEDALAYFEQLKATQEKEKPPFTENGAKVLEYMQQHHQECNNIFKAKDIGEGLFLPSSRTVSGAMRKLITDGYVDKIAGNPVCYTLTPVGMDIQVIYPEAPEA